MPSPRERAHDVALILLNWRDVERTIAGVRAAIENDVFGQIIVVDNETTTEVTDALVATFGGDIDVVPIAENRGYGAAHNRGIQAVRPHIKFVMLLNTDAVISRDSVLALRARHERDPDIGAASPVIYNFPATSGTTVQTAGGDIRSYRGNVVQRTATRAPDPDYTTFAACMLRLSALPPEPFDERQFMYWEDVDLCWRMTRSGYRVVIVADASAWHELSASAAAPGLGQARLIVYNYWAARVFAAKRKGLFRPMVYVRGYASWAVRRLGGDAVRANAVLAGIRLPIPARAAWSVKEDLLREVDATLTRQMSGA